MIQSGDLFASVANLLSEEEITTHFELPGARSESIVSTEQASPEMPPPMI